MQYIYLHLQQLFHYIHAHQSIGILLAFVIAFAESLPLIGTIIPGSLTMTTLGTFIGTGALPIGPVFFWSIIGAYVGDTLSFAFGKHYQEQLTTIWPLSRYPKLTSKGEAFFHKHGGKSIIIGRFVGPIRSAVPLIAGMLNLSWGRYIIAAIPSVILWATLYLTPGVILGLLSTDLPPGAASKMVISGIIAIVAIWCAFWLIQRLFKQLTYFVDTLMRHLWAYLLMAHRATRWFTRWIRNSYRTKDHRQLTLFCLGVLFLCLFIFLTVCNFLQIFLTHWNIPLFHFLQSIRTHWADTLFIYILFLSEPTVIVIGVILASLVLLFKHYHRRHIIFIWVTLFTTLIALLICQIWGRTYHPLLLTNSQNIGLINYHLLLSITTYGFLAYSVAYQLHRSWQYIPYLIASSIAILIAFSALYIGIDWIAHTLTTITLALGILLFNILAFRRRLPPAHMRLPSLSCFIIASFLIPWVSYAHTHSKIAHHEFQRIWLTQNIAFNHWWRHPLTTMPAFRTNRLGQPNSPLNVQWAAPLSQIRNLLKTDKWILTQEQKKDLQKKLSSLLNQNPSQQPPIIKSLYRDQASVLIAFHTSTNPNILIELHLWNSGVILTRPTSRLWIGTVNYRRIHRGFFPLGRRSTKKMSFKGDSGVSAMNTLLHGSKDYVYKIMHTRVNTLPPQLKEIEWNGDIIVIRAAPKENKNAD